MQGGWAFLDMEKSDDDDEDEEASSEGFNPGSDAEEEEEESSEDMSDEVRSLVLQPGCIAWCYSLVALLAHNMTRLHLHQHLP